MEAINPPIFTIKYDQKDVTTELSEYLSTITYKDSVKGRSDEIELEFSNVSGKWLDTWAPAFGDTLAVTMGYGRYQFPCGTFEIDEIEVRFSPDVFVIKGLAAGIKQAVRTEYSDAHENKTLQQIAQKICTRHGFTLQFDIDRGGVINTPNTIRRVTQNRETDLAFLAGLADEYGFAFSVRDKVMTFVNIYELEKLPSATTIFKEDFIPGSCTIKDKSWEVYNKAQLSYRNPRTNTVEETDFQFEQQANSDGYEMSNLVKKDVKKIFLKANNGAEATAKAMAALHSANSKQQEASLSVRGNPLMVAGNNITLAGIDKFSGVYHIESTVHRLNVNSGYTTQLMCKRVGFITLVNTKPKKPKKYVPKKAIITGG